ncbi:putative glycoside hydrolase [Nocardioides sp. SYSU DS0663]|uniref:putative glycoside hydrolase n=1 Tax=Nocardioides sp. SYSU DS0663 TaxID=3416445 RepID=UPI003F4B8CF8
MRSLPHVLVTLTATASLFAATPAPAGAANDSLTVTAQATSGQAAARTSAPAGRVALTWAPTYMANDHHYTRREARRLARQFDLIAGMPIAFQDHVSAMRRANRHLDLIAYSNATLAAPTEVRGLPESAFAHDTAGRRITANGWGTFLMESSSQAWRDAAVRQCDQRSDLGGYDGCLVDMLTLGIFSKNFVTALPVVPGTGRTYTQAEYRTQMAQLSDVYSRQQPGLILVGNAVENSYRYWQSDVPSRPLATGMPGAQMEDFLRGAHDSVTDLPRGGEWRRNVRVIKDLERHGVTGLFTTKLWVGASTKQVKRWQAYAISSFLMGADGNSYLAFTRSRDQAGATARNAPYSMPRSIGTPKGKMRRTGSGAWKRAFTGGVSVVNPTGRARVVRLGKPHRTLDGKIVRKIRLRPRTGDVLVRTR